MTIEYLVWHHVVLLQPPGPRVETVCYLRIVKTVTNVSFGVFGAAAVGYSIDLAPPYDVGRGGS